MDYIFKYDDIRKNIFLNKLYKDIGCSIVMRIELFSDEIEHIKSNLEKSNYSYEQILVEKNNDPQHFSSNVFMKLFPNKLSTSYMYVTPQSMKNIHFFDNITYINIDMLFVESSKTNEYIDKIKEKPLSEIITDSQVHGILQQKDLDNDTISFSLSCKDNKINNLAAKIYQKILNKKYFVTEQTNTLTKLLVNKQQVFDNISNNEEYSFVVMLEGYEKDLSYILDISNMTLLKKSSSTNKILDRIKIYASISKDSSLLQIFDYDIGEFICFAVKKGAEQNLIAKIDTLKTNIIETLFNIVTNSEKYEAYLTDEAPICIKNNSTLDDMFEVVINTTAIDIHALLEENIK